MQQSKQNRPRWTPATKSYTQQQSEFTVYVRFKPECVTSEAAKFGIKRHSWKQEHRLMNGKLVKDLKHAWERMIALVTDYYMGSHTTVEIYWNKTNETVYKLSYDRPQIICEPVFAVDTDENIIVTHFATQLNRLNIKK